MKLLAASTVLALIVSSAVGAQQTTRAGSANEASYQTKTLALRHLSDVDAVTLLTPYVIGKGGVYATSASRTIRAVTVRGAPETIAELERLLAQYDRSPATVSLTFQLIAADNSGRRDASLTGVDSLLRGVLKFTGYHLLTSAVANVTEGSEASQTLNANLKQYELACAVLEIIGDGANATARVHITLMRNLTTTAPGTPSPNPILLRTGATIPIGHTVVLGSSGDYGTRGGSTEPNQVLILTVRPQIVPPGKEQ